MILLALDQQVEDAYKNGYTLYASHLVWGATEPGVLPDWLKKVDTQKMNFYQSSNTM